jgi:hypothetical protein
METCNGLDLSNIQKQSVISINKENYAIEDNRGNAGLDAQQQHKIHAT